MFHAVKINALKPKDKPYKDTGDGKGNGGLYLWVTPTGSKIWRQNYRFQGKNLTITHGNYPEVSIVDAQHARDEVKRMLRQGIDPMTARKEARREALREAKTVRMIAEDWFARNNAKWSEGTRLCYRAALEKKIYPAFGDIPVAQLERRKLAEFVLELEKSSGPTTAKKAQMLLSEIFRKAVLEDLCSFNPAAELSGVVTKPPVKHHNAITDPQEVGKLLLDMDDYIQGSPSVAYALRLLPYTFVRVCELCRAQWSEIDMEAATWTIPPGRMKMKRPHVVPLARQVVEQLRELSALHLSDTYLFPSEKTGRPICTEAIWQALEAKGYKGLHTPHGFRGTASTLLYERIKARPHVIEAQLAHVMGNKTQAAYCHAEYLDERREMMQQYADYLDTLKEKARKERADESDH